MTMASKPTYAIPRKPPLIPKRTLAELEPHGGTNEPGSKCSHGPAWGPLKAETCSNALKGLACLPPWRTGPSKQPSRF